MEIKEEDLGKETKKAFEIIFAGDLGKLVLENLDRIGYVNETTLTPDPVITGYNEGLRAMAMYIRVMTQVVSETETQEEAVKEPIINIPKWKD